MASLNVRLVCTNQEGGTAQIVATTSNPVDIPSEVFVIKVGTEGTPDRYDRIATTHDIQTWPSIRDASLAFYRTSEATLTFSDINTASTAKQSIQESIQRIVSEYEIAQADFVGVLDVVIVSED